MKPNLLAACLMFPSALLCSCTPKNEFVAPPPPPVTVATPLIQDVTVYQTFPGRVESVNAVDITARVSGFLEDAPFTEGQPVSKGDLLFTIEPDRYEAAVASAQATLAQAQAAQKLADASLQRKQKAFDAQAVSELDVLSAEAELQSAEAAIQTAEAGLITAELNLSYAHVLSPIDGWAGRHLVSQGNLVGVTGPTLLTTVVQLDPIYVYFNVAERALLPHLTTLTRTDDAPPLPNVLLETANGERYSHSGQIDFADNALNRQTGTLSVRARFANPDSQLRPGLFGRILVPRQLDQAVIVPDRAIQKDMAGTYVLTLDTSNIVQTSYVTTGDRIDEFRIITEGLSGTERVVINGIQRARPGSPVSPKDSVLRMETKSPRDGNALFASQPDA